MISIFFREMRIGELRIFVLRRRFVIYMSCYTFQSVHEPFLDSYWGDRPMQGILTNHMWLCKSLQGEFFFCFSPLGYTLHVTQVNNSNFARWRVQFTSILPCFLQWWWKQHVPNRDAESCHGTMPRCNTAKVVSTRDRSIKQKFWGLHGTLVLCFLDW